MYAKNYDFKYVKKVDEFVPYSYKDLINIYFTVLNNGTDTFTFYCPDEYVDCLDDIKTLGKDNTTLSNIASFVHPYNNFKTITAKSDSSGEIILHINHLYSESDIKKVEKEIDSIIKNNITDEMNTYDKIKTFHDYIINNTKYDGDFAKDNPIYEESSKATGLLFNHKAVCSGYADIMAIYLTKLNLKNFKIASDSHVWNAVYINDEDGWVHIDMTWDDPVILNSNEDTLLHKFFLINTDALKEFNTGNHNFDSNIYQEV